MEGAAWPTCLVFSIFSNKISIMGSHYFKYSHYAAIRAIFFVSFFYNYLINISRPVNDKTIKEIVNKNSDSMIGIRSVDICSDSEILNYTKRLEKRTL